MSTAPQVNNAVVLDENEVSMARVAVRLYLGKIRKAWRTDVSRGDEHHAEVKADRFDDFLDLYELLGGDPDKVPDLDEIGG